jgi:hypothetical protein
MAEVTSTTGTTLDVPVLPDSRVRYQALPPAGRPHDLYQVRLGEPGRRDRRGA